MIYEQTAPIGVVSLDETKAHLRIDYDYEDELIASYILAATQLAEHILQREIVQRVDPCALCKEVKDAPQLVKHFVLCQIGDFFANRELSTSQVVNTRYSHLLDNLIKFNRTDEENTPIDEDQS